MDKDSKDSRLEAYDRPVPEPLPAMIAKNLSVIADCEKEVEWKRQKGREEAACNSDDLPPLLILNRCNVARYEFKSMTARR
jgi:hypothetical protein